MLTEKTLIELCKKEKIELFKTESVLDEDADILLDTQDELVDQEYKARKN